MNSRARCFLSPMIATSLINWRRRYGLLRMVCYIPAWAITLSIAHINNALHKILLQAKLLKLQGKQNLLLYLLRNRLAKEVARRRFARKKTVSVILRKRRRIFGL